LIEYRAEDPEVFISRIQDDTGTGEERDGGGGTGSREEPTMSCRNSI